MTTLAEAAETIVDPVAYADRARVDEAFAWLRREAPLVQVSPKDYDQFWAVTRHADILEVERQNELFHNGDRASVLANAERVRHVQQLTGGPPYLIRTLISMDDPDHMAYRRITQGAFLPQKLRALEGRVRQLARDAVDRMAAYGGRCDFAKDIALHYPLKVIMELLGVPAEDEPRMLKLTQEVFGEADPELNRSNAALDAIQQAEDQRRTFADFMEYFNAMTEDRRRCPRDDLATIISNAKIEGCPLNHADALSYYIIVATAGHDTTSNTTAGGLWALAENPDQFAKLKADPSLIAGHVEESIRWETSVKHFMRSATADAEIAGQKISKGDWLMLCYQSGNRDESVFDEPFCYNIERSPNRHLAFGYGAHVCLGQHLGRLEMRLFWEELLPRLESLELDGTPARSQATFVSGPKTVPIRYRMN